MPSEICISSWTRHVNLINNDKNFGIRELLVVVTRFSTNPNGVKSPELPRLHIIVIVILCRTFHCYMKSFQDKNSFPSWSPNFPNFLNEVPPSQISPREKSISPISKIWYMYFQNIFIPVKTYTGYLIFLLV